MIQLTNRQARQFLLLKHGLLGEYKFSEKKGVLDFARQVNLHSIRPHRCLWKKRRIGATVANQGIYQGNACRVAV